MLRINMFRIDAIFINSLHYHFFLLLVIKHFSLFLCCCFIFYFIYQKIKGKSVEVLLYANLYTNSHFICKDITWNKQCLDVFQQNKALKSLCEIWWTWWPKRFRTIEKNMLYISVVLFLSYPSYSICHNILFPTFVNTKFSSLQLCSFALQI